MNGVIYVHKRRMKTRIEVAVEFLLLASLDRDRERRPLNKSNQRIHKRKAEQMKPMEKDHNNITCNGL